MGSKCPDLVIYKAVIISNIGVSISKISFLQNCTDTKYSVCFLSYVSVYFPYILKYISVCRYFTPWKLKLEAYPKFWSCAFPPKYIQGTLQNNMNVIVHFKTKNISRYNLLEIWNSQSGVGQDSHIVGHGDAYIGKRLLIYLCTRNRMLRYNACNGKIKFVSKLRQYTYLLTPWCRVLLEKLTGLQLVKKLPALHGTRMFIAALTTVRHPSLFWDSPIQSIYTHPTSWSSVLISAHLRLGLPVVSFPPVSPPRPHTPPSPHPYAPHAQPITFFSILSPAQYWVRSASHLAPRYAISSIPTLPRPS